MAGQFHTRIATLLLLLFTLAFAPRHATAAGVVTGIPSTNYAILKSGDWTPSTEQARAALLAIQAFLDQPAPTNATLRADIKQVQTFKGPYHLQITGMIKNGKKFIRCYFISSDMIRFIPNWRTVPVSINDGGPSVWQIHYDPVTGRCFGFAVNGIA